MPKKKKNHGKTRPNNNFNQVIPSTNPDSLKPSKEKLDEWHKKYNELYDRHCTLVAGKNGLVHAKKQIEGKTELTRFNIETFDIQTQSIEWHPDAIEFNEQIYLLASECQTAVNQLTKQNMFCNDTLIIYMKTLMLHALFLYTIHKYDKTHEYFGAVLYLWKKYGSRLNYENDMEFQYRIEFLFSMVTVDKNDLSHIKLKKEFATKCSSTLAGLKISYNALLKIYENNSFDDLKNNPQLETNLRNTKNTFIFQADKITKRYINLQTENRLTTEFKVYWINLNYLMIDIFNIGHPDRIFALENERLAIYQLPEDHLFERYLKSWQRLNQTYIAPTFKLIESIDVNEFGMSFYGCFSIALSGWLTEFHVILDLFNSMIERWMQKIELATEANETIKKYLVKLNDEKKNLLKHTHVIRGLVHPFRYLLGEETGLLSVTTYEKVAQCDNRISLIEEDMHLQEQAKIKLAEVTSKQLIDEEDALKKAAALKKQKIRQYILNKKKKITLDDYSLEEEESFCTNFPVKEKVISPERRQLETFDEDCFRLADELQAKITANNKFLTGRLNFAIPFPAAYQQEIMLNIHGLFAEYYYLVASFEQFNTFSKRDEIVKMDELQKGIVTSRTIFAQKAVTIYASINAMLDLANTMILKQKQRRQNKIYEVGLEFVQQQNLTGLSYDEIMNYGKEIFKQMGIYKSKNGIGVSAFTKNRDFLNMMQLSFSGFGYLQNKMLTALENPQQKFKIFSSVQSELKRHELTPAVIEELMGIILEQNYDEFNDEACRKQAMIHFRKALGLYEEEEDVDSITNVRKRMNAIEKTFVTDFVGSYSPSFNRL